MRLYFLAKLLAVFFCCTVSENVKLEYCVVPNTINYSNPCDDRVACKNSCGPLSHFVDLQREFNNVQFMFYEGTHYLHQIWEISGGSNLVFYARKEGEVKVKCTADESGMNFSAVTQIQLKGIEFITCGISSSSKRAALVFIDVNGLSLHAIKIQEPTTASGFYFSNVQGMVSIEDSLFQNAMIGSNYTSGNFIGYYECGNGSTVLTIKNTTFENNTQNLNRACNGRDKRLAAGLSVVLKCLEVQIRMSNVTLRNNTSCAGGNVAILYLTMDKKKGLENTAVTIDQNSVIEQGYGNVGGGLFVVFVNSRGHGTVSPNVTTVLLTLKNTTIINNIGAFRGGGVFIKHLEGLKHTVDGTILITDCHFEGNKLKKAETSGGYAIHFATYIARGYKKNYRPQLQTNILSSNFINHGMYATGDQTENVPRYGDAVIQVKSTPYFGISNTIIVNNNCSGLTAISSNIILSDKVNISNNTAYSGGGILLSSSALLYFKQHTNLTITGNHAKHTGGGICVETECGLGCACFFQLSSSVGFNTSLLVTLNATVRGNTANYAGNNIYGGSIDDCYIINSEKYKKKALSFFHIIFYVAKNSAKHNSSIASQPRKVCIRDNAARNNTLEKHIYPGQTFHINTVIQGQLDSFVPGTVYATLDKNAETYLGQENKIQAIQSLKSEKLNYRVFSEVSNLTVLLKLTVQELGANPHAAITTIRLSIKDCPLGLKLEIKSKQSACRCVDLEKIPHVRGKVECSISQNISIRYSPKLWIGVVKEDITQTIALSITCPRDYCNFTTNYTFLYLDRQISNTIQCAFNRCGVLCGNCTAGNSVTFGSSECRECSNLSLLLLFFFAFAGLALVFFIAFLNLTVSAATLNGIIFYANIVQIYSFFILNDTYPFLKVFISWLNLDFGINACFFDGMDGLSKSLLQFAFPIYLWIIAGMIIILSRRYKFMMKLFGSNTVQVLATLILLSYTKIIRASSDAVHFTHLLLIPKGYSSRWSMDGNLKFLEGNHILVFTVGALFGMITLPYFIILLCIGQLPRISNWPLCSWVYKLKPFFDCYTGMFSNKGRFWVGLLLFARMVLLAVYSVNISNSEVLKMTITVLVTLILLTVAILFPKGVYSKHYLNILECFSIANLGSLFVGLLCCYYYDLAKKLIVTISISICFVLFVLVILCHVYQKLRCNKFSRWARFRRYTSFDQWQNSHEGSLSYVELNEECEPLLVNHD